MPYFNLGSDFVTVFLLNNLNRLQLFVIIFNCIRMSERSQQAQGVNEVVFNMKLTTLPLWSIDEVACDFHANSNH